MFKKIVDVLKEVFWLKRSSRKKPLSKRRSAVAKKKAVRKVPLTSKVVKPKALAVKAAAKPKVPALDPGLVQAGEITHYFDRIKVAVVKITGGSILIGDKLTMMGIKAKFVQKVWSMQIESADVKVGKKGQLVGLKVDKPVAVGDKVYK